MVNKLGYIYFTYLMKVRQKAGAAVRPRDDGSGWNLRMFHPPRNANRAKECLRLREGRRFLFFLINI